MGENPRVHPTSAASNSIPSRGWRGVFVFRWIFKKKKKSDYLLLFFFFGKYRGTRLVRVTDGLVGSGDDVYLEIWFFFFEVVDDIRRWRFLNCCTFPKNRMFEGNKLYSWVRENVKSHPKHRVKNSNSRYKLIAWFCDSIFYGINIYNVGYNFKFTVLALIRIITDNWSINCSKRGTRRFTQYGFPLPIPRCNKFSKHFRSSLHS